jgi:hypothetical protein
MAKIDYIEFRLLNWARWKMRAGGRLNYAGINWESAGTSSGYREAVIPIDDCDASVTNDAVLQLPKHLQETLLEHYTGEHTDVPTQARKLGCGVSTVHARIEDAHHRLSAYFYAKAEAGRVEQERIAAASGRPIARKKEFYEL